MKRIAMLMSLLLAMVCAFCMPAESLADEADGFSCGLTSDLAKLRIVYKGGGEEQLGDVSFVVNGTSYQAEHAFDGSYRADVGMDESLVGSVEVSALNEGERVATKTVDLPAIPEAAGDRLASLAFGVALSDGAELSFAPQHGRSWEYVFLPSGSNVGALRVSFDEAGADNVKVRNALGGSSLQAVSNGDVLDVNTLDGFSACDAHFLEFTYEQAGEQKSYVVGLMVGEGINSVFLTSADPVNKGRGYVESSPDHTNSAKGSVALYDSSLGKTYEGALSQIKGRGNSTWNAQKKPYQIKLDKKADLLDPVDGAQKAKKWLLLSNPFDVTLLHNQLIYGLAYQTGLTSTPEGVPVNLYYDGEYRGAYYLCEKNEISANCVDIHNLEDDIEDANPDVDMDALPQATGTNNYGHEMRYSDGLNDPEDITGGYLLELDVVFYDKEPCYMWVESNGVKYAFVPKQPEYLSGHACTYIADFLDEAHACFMNRGVNPKTGKQIFDYLDKETAIRYLMIMQWCNNNDAFTSSTFFYKPQGEDKLYAGPVWDCDDSFGARTDAVIPTTWRIVGWGKWWLNSSAFKEAFVDYYDEFEPLVRDMAFGSGRDGKKTWVQEASELEPSAEMNYALWDRELIWDDSAGEFLLHTDDCWWQDVTDMFNWAQQRTDWMGKELRGANAVRVFGDTRYETSLKLADCLKQRRGTDKFDAVVLATGNNFPDALCATYLADSCNAPVIITCADKAALVNAYINENLNEGGKVYVLGGEEAVPSTWLSSLTAPVQRISGNSRYETSIEIIKTVGEEPHSLLVCTGSGYADSLSASAVGLPVLLVDGERGLSDIQREYLDTLPLDTIYVVGGTSAISGATEDQLKQYANVERLSGEDRYETSRMVAERFFSMDTDAVVLAYSHNYPDGLCGGPVAQAYGAPMLLCQTSSMNQVKYYVDEADSNDVLVLGGGILISDDAVSGLFDRLMPTTITVFKP